MATITLLGDDAEHFVFSLFQKEGETNESFLYRIFGYAEFWCPLVENDRWIPETGLVRIVWNNYNEIREMIHEELYEHIWDTEDDPLMRSSGFEGVYCRTWLTLLRVEAERRHKTSV